MIEETLLDTLKMVRNKLPFIYAILSNGEINKQRREMIKSCIEAIEEEIDNYVERNK